MQGYAKMLTMGTLGELTDQQLQFVEVIRSNVDRMGNLLNDLNEVSRLEAGRTVLKLAPVRIQDVVQQVMSDAQAKFEDRQHTFEAFADERLPPVMADYDRLVKILTNLVSNGCRYTPSGGTIRIMVEEDAPPEKKAKGLRITVADTGIGISTRDLDRLGEKFFRADHNLVQEQPGSGLGVPIARSLVELHGGELGVTSEPNKGSTFSFALPIAS
jgi:two-component system phosphate regulon sensor histidine kinase PhoR